MDRVFPSSYFMPVAAAAAAASAAIDGSEQTAWRTSEPPSREITMLQSTCQIPDLIISSSIFDRVPNPYLADGWYRRRSRLTDFCALTAGRRNAITVADRSKMWDVSLLQPRSVWLAHKKEITSATSYYLTNECRMYFGFKLGLPSKIMPTGIVKFVNIV